MNIESERFSGLKSVKDGSEVNASRACEEALQLLSRPKNSNDNGIFREKPVGDKTKEPTEEELVKKYQEAFRRKNWDEAEKVLKQLLAIAKKTDGPVSEGVQLVLRELGKVCAFDSRFGDAKDYYKQAIDIDKQVFGKDDIRTAEDYASLGLMDAMMGNYKEAADSYEESLRIFKTNYPMKNWKVAEEMAAVICDYNNQVVLKLQDTKRNKELFGELINLAGRWRGMVGNDHGKLSITWL